MISSSSPEFILEDKPIYDNNPRYPFERTQDEHIEYFNSVNKIMACAADYYHSTTVRDPVSGKRAGIDFFDHAIITSDRVRFDDANKCNIISYYGSKVVKPQERQLIIPDVFNKERKYRTRRLNDEVTVNDNLITLDEVLESRNGLGFLQVLFDTIDDLPDMKENLRLITLRESYRTVIRVPEYNYRNENPEYIITITHDSDLSPSINFVKYISKGLLAAEGTATALRRIG